MSLSGTAAYTDLEHLPPLVKAAVERARADGFEKSCLPEHGELLRVLARGVGAGKIGETGTGGGVGLAWLASGAQPGASLVSVEIDAERAASAAEPFTDRADISILTGSWQLLHEFAPFDLLVLDGGGQGKRAGGEKPIDPAQWLRPGGLIVMDDFAPLREWPPRHEGVVDEPRLFWFGHPRLRTTQINVTPDASVILATYVG